MVMSSDVAMSVAMVTFHGKKLHVLPWSCYSDRLVVMAIVVIVIVAMAFCIVTMATVARLVAMEICISCSSDDPIHVACCHGIGKVIAGETEEHLLSFQYFVTSL